MSDSLHSIIIEHHRETMSALERLSVRVSRLERDVGKGGPSLPPGGLAQRARENTEAITDFEARVIRELARQSAWMGIGSGFLGWLRSPEGGRTMVAVATLIGAAAAALR